MLHDDFQYKRPIDMTVQTEAPNGCEEVRGVGELSLVYPVQARTWDIRYDNRE